MMGEEQEMVCTIGLLPLTSFDLVLKKRFDRDLYSKSFEF